MHWSNKQYTIIRKSHYSCLLIRTLVENTEREGICQGLTFPS